MRSGQQRTGQPTHGSPTCGGQMYRTALRVQKVDLNRSQLKLAFSPQNWSSQSLLLHLLLIFALILSRRWPVTRCPYFLTSTPIALLLCFGRVYMWHISGAQVKYKSKAALTSCALWFPFGPMPCNQSLLLFSFSSSLFSFWRRLQKAWEISWFKNEYHVFRKHQRPKRGYKVR